MMDVYLWKAPWGLGNSKFKHSLCIIVIVKINLKCVCCHVTILLVNNVIFDVHIIIMINSLYSWQVHLHSTTFSDSFVQYHVALTCSLYSSIFCRALCIIRRALSDRSTTLSWCVTLHRSRLLIYMHSWCSFLSVI